ncbi:unnamed protein product [Medioppia subpectinata]|uniref:Uncharacterized protein n=1 Tax=Medioppia subpectinata TaxID=1979941 RepID=A0A7R9Q009_9ACAR|nr:unnamed protein product [Medioppia subpectinata]CAG2106717.1 unnamed protein product [Medioppia subpectinata]
MAGSDTNPDNECFCVNDNTDHCRLDGVYDMSACQHDIPIIVSLPHFLGGDKRITDRIEGLKPDPKFHRPVIHVEPTLGAVIHGDSKLQMAIRVPKNDYIIGFETPNNDRYIPLFWAISNTKLLFKRDPKHLNTISIILLMFISLELLGRSYVQSVFYNKIGLRRHNTGITKEFSTAKKFFWLRNSLYSMSIFILMR